MGKTLMEILGMSDDTPKKIGRPRKGTERRERAWFSVSAEHMRWLQTLPNRSAWLAEQITKAQEGKQDDNEPSSSPR